jgi:hypothetical protein
MISWLGEEIVEPHFPSVALGSFWLWLVAFLIHLAALRQASHELSHTSAHEKTSVSRPCGVARDMKVRHRGLILYQLLPSYV